MKTRRFLVWSGVLVVAIALVAAVWQPISIGAQRGKKAAQAAQARSADDEKPTTSVVDTKAVTLRVRFGSKPVAGQASKREPTAWDGELTVTGGTLRQLRLWQDDPRDNVDGTRWVLSTKHNTPWNSEERKKGHEAMPVGDTGLTVDLSQAAPDTKLDFDTAQGKFNFTLADVAWGESKGFLAGMVQVSRLANTGLILSAPTEDDYPSAAQSPDGKLYVAYVAFTHGKDFRTRGVIEDATKALDNLDQPTGGDQVCLLRLDGDRWTGPLPVTPPGQDVFRTATAIDAGGRVWIFWTAKQNNQWDLFARSLKGEQWSDVRQLTNEAEPDLLPAATTDAAGKVWVAWQAFRGGKSKILAMRQEGDSFGSAMTVAEGKANAWAPAIAASGKGPVAVAWDTYAKGDYDVYCRVFSGGQWGEPVAVAASLQGEMRPSLTYDNDGRLWIAYETAAEKWGKDFGPYDRDGVGLYGTRSIDVRVLADGKLWRTFGGPADAFAKFAAGKPAAKKKIEAARPKAGPGQNTRLCAPRLCVDKSGRVWLAARSNALTGRAPVGPWWFEHVVWYEGNAWSSQILCPQTDNILDNRPALLPDVGGGVLMIASTDGRFATAGNLPQWFMQDLRRKGDKLFQHAAGPRWPDQVNNELVLAAMGPVPGAGPVKMVLEPADDAVAAPSAEAKAEAEAVARARAARVQIGGKTLRLWRGEFHRHTELSPDGTGDGMLMDMWRYALDAASFDWIGCGDHDNGNGREYSWWYTQKTTDLLTLPGLFTPVFSYERSCNYPDGHRNAVFAQRGIRTLPRLKDGLGKALDELPADAQRPNTPDTQMLYRYLAKFDGVCASHTSGTDMGTDWRDNNAKVEPIVEIYQGCRQNYEMPDAPRSNSAGNSIGGWRPLGFISLALKKGYRLGFQSSSDHGSTHISLCNCWVAEPSRAGVLAAMKARHVYGSTDNIVAVARCGDYFMGDEFTTAAKPRISVQITGTGPLAKVHVIKDGNYVHTLEPNKPEVDFQWTDMDCKPGKTSYYYIRGEQADGELVWVSPMWITYKP